MWSPSPTCRASIPSRYGILDVESATTAAWPAPRDLVEKPEPAKAPSTLVDHRPLHPASQRLRAIWTSRCKGAGNEIQLTDAIAQHHRRACPSTACASKGRRFDCGDKVGWLQANLAFALSTPRHARAGCWRSSRNSTRNHVVITAAAVRTAHHAHCHDRNGLCRAGVRRLFLRIRHRCRLRRQGRRQDRSA